MIYLDRDLRYLILFCIFSVKKGVNQFLLSTLNLGSEDHKLDPNSNIKPIIFLFV